MKLLIVDDEERTREMLCKHINWLEIGIHEVESARNGMLALEYCQKSSPDIVLCDIRMPKMDGIEFANQLRKGGASCKLLFMSGFSDKEYLMSAIRLNALDYIEKPIDLEKVKKAVKVAVESRRLEEQKQLEERHLQQTYDEGLPYLRQEMVRKLVTNPGSHNVSKALESRETFLLPVKGPYTVIASSFNWRFARFPDEPQPAHELLLRELNMNTKLTLLGGICGFDEKKCLILIMPGTFGSSYQEQRSVLEELYADISKGIDSNIRFCMGVGESVKELLQIPNSYQTALNACNLHYYNEVSRLIFADALGGNRALETDWEMVKKLRRLLKEEKIEDARKLIMDWTERARIARDLDINRLKDSYFQFLLAILDVAVQIGVSETDEEMERRYIWQEINQVPDLSSMEEYLLSFLELFKLPDAGTGSSAKLRDIIQFIHKKFHEKGFAIPDIAKHVGMNETYLCSMFKKQRGTTIKEYISLLRVDKAKELLLDKDLRLYEVADQTGFTDANYFTTFFKKYTGNTPSEYRERMSK